MATFSRSENSSSDEEMVQHFRHEELADSVTLFHELLVEIAVGRYVPREADINSGTVTDDSVMTVSGLEQLALMIQLDFLVSVSAT